MSLALDNPMLSLFRPDDPPGIVSDWLQDQQASLQDVLALHAGTPQKEFRDGLRVEVLAEFVRCTCDRHVLRTDRSSGLISDLLLQIKEEDPRHAKLLALSLFPATTFRREWRVRRYCKVYEGRRQRHIGDGEDIPILPHRPLDVKEDGGVTVLSQPCTAADYLLDSRVEWEKWHPCGGPWETMRFV